jgi:hypothetical protein
MAARWVADQPFPGVVEIQFTEYDGTSVMIHEKASVVNAGLGPAMCYPVEILLDAEIITVSTPAWAVRLLNGIEDLTGRTEFIVGWNLVRSLPAGQERGN